MRPEKMIPGSETDVFDVATSKKIKRMKKAMQALIDSDEKRYFAASNECGFKERAIMLKTNEGYETFFNPIAADRDDRKFYREYDPITEEEFILVRHTKLTLVYDNEEGKRQINKLSQDSAVIVEQAISVLDGVEDGVIGLQVTKEYDEATPEEQEELLKAYMDELKKLSDELDKELCADENLNKQWNAYKFSEAVANGEVELMDPTPKQPNRKTRRSLMKAMKKYAKNKNNK